MRFVTCDQCSTPIFEVRGNCVVVKAKHHHEWHTSVIPIKQLVAKACEQGLDNTQQSAILALKHSSE